MAPNSPSAAGRHSGPAPETVFPVLKLDPEGSLSLQAQIRRGLVQAITSGSLAPGARLPGTRRLAEMLGVSRNTVTFAYQQLAAEGLIVNRERFSFFVAEELRIERVSLPEGVQRVKRDTGEFSWAARLQSRSATPTGNRIPPDWQRYPFPFLDGRFDISLYPVNEWREAARLALGVREIVRWSVDAGEADDEFLVEEIRTKVLPRRGIEARPEEILITAGAQQALFAAVQILAGRGTVAAIEEPGNPDLREMLARRGASLVHQPVDQDGLIVDERLDRSGLVFVTPNHQFPTAATLSLERRRALLGKASEHDMIVVENDVDYETKYAGHSPPALKALDHEGRVVYLAGLSKMFGPALRLGFMVAAPELLQEVRKLRRLMMRHPPLHNQRTAAFFLSLGHYDAAMLRLSRVCKERSAALVEALDHYLPYIVDLHVTPGSISFFVRGPEDLNVHDVVGEAARRGVLIEPADTYFAGADAPRNVFRMGVTSLPLEKIRPGVSALAAVIRDMTGREKERLEEATGRWLRGHELRAEIENHTYLYQGVYGRPHRFQLSPDGTMSGHAGYANEDRDTGVWWVEDDRWFRRWSRWAYGEVQGFYVVVDGDEIKWFNAKGKMVDRAVVAAAEVEEPVG